MQKKRKNGEGIRFSAVNVKRLLKKKEMGWQFLPVKGGESYLFPFTPLLYHTKSKLAVKPK